MAAGSYIPSCLVQSWHNNNNLNENSHAATTDLLVGLEICRHPIGHHLPREIRTKCIPALIATCCCNGVAMAFVLVLGCLMKADNRRETRHKV